MRSSTVAILAVAGLLLAAVPVAADHVYSHRYLVYGTVVDAEGNPVEGVQVDVDLSPFRDFEGPCPQEQSGGTGRQQTTTDAVGRYWYCGHVHSSGSTEQRFTVTAAGNEKTVTSNPDHRRSQVNIQLDATAQDSQGDVESFDSSYRLRGIAWKPDDTRLAGHSVNGIALSYEPVNATIELSDGTTYEGTFVNSPFNSPQYNRQLREPRDNVTDRYGDFLFQWTNLPEDISGAQVTVTSGDQTTTQDVDTAYRHSTAAVEFPGEGLNLSVLWILGGLIVLGVAGYFGYEPAKERWEEYKRDRRMRRLEEESDRDRS
jgi:hypothetical protein